MATSISTPTTPLILKALGSAFLALAALAATQGLFGWPVAGWTAIGSLAVSLIGLGAVIWKHRQAGTPAEPVAIAGASVTLLASVAGVTAAFGGWAPGKPELDAIGTSIIAAATIFAALSARSKVTPWPVPGSNGPAPSDGREGQPQPPSGRGVPAGGAP